MKPMPSALSTSNAYSISERAFHIRHRHTGEQPEPAGMRAHHVGTVLVADARHLARCHGLAEPDARRRNREHRSHNTVAIHVVDRPGNRPGSLNWGLAGKPRLLIPGRKRLQVRWRKEMVMRVDDAPWSRRLGTRA